MDMEWYDNDELWETMGYFMFTEEAWAAAPEQVDQVLALTSLPPGAAVLDLGCGVGRHSLELARRGYRVTGVDRNTQYLDTACEKAETESLSVEWVEEDMRRFQRPNAFDGAISLYTSFSYFREHAENMQVLRNVCASLKPGGAFYMEQLGKEILARIFRDNNWEERNGAFQLTQRRPVNNWSQMENRWIFIRDGKVSEYLIRHWIYSAVEMTAMLKEAGFNTVEVYGDGQGAAYDQSARRMITLARKGNA